MFKVFGRKAGNIVENLTKITTVSGLLLWNAISLIMGK